MASVAGALFFVCVFHYAGTFAAPVPGRAGDPVADTGQVKCYDHRREIACPGPGAAFYGQDAQYQNDKPAAYRDNRDGTITDLTTGLVWSRASGSRKVDLKEARKIAREMKLGGYSDWRVPNIKELYSLIDFRGYTGFGRRGFSGEAPPNAVPFINTDYFDFQYGNVKAGERYIDAQWLSGTKYVSTTMGGMETLFGVNFADGRIKGYGYKRPGNFRSHKKFFVRFVRGGPYGVNRFRANGDGTITDLSSGLTWTRRDSGRPMNWSAALAYAENLKYAGRQDWRLPNAKELQYIVDYSRSPDTTDSPAIDPVFRTTSITNEAGQKDYPHFWTSTTHLDGPRPGSHAVYIAFGRAMGKMRGRIMDVHGAGAQRSDPKTGRPGIGHGPQGDARRVKNFVRCVRGGPVTKRTKTPAANKSRYPYKLNIKKSASTESPQRPGAGRRPARGPGPARFVERLDRDGDGRVSKSEFDGPPDRFGDFDKNQDGYITEAEAPRGPPPDGGGPRRPRGPRIERGP